MYFLSVQKKKKKVSWGKNKTILLGPFSCYHIEPLSCAIGSLHMHGCCHVCPQLIVFSDPALSLMLSCSTSF